MVWSGKSDNDTTVCSKVGDHVRKEQPAISTGTTATDDTALEKTRLTSQQVHISRADREK